MAVGPAALENTLVHGLRAVGDEMPVVAPLCPTAAFTCEPRLQAPVVQEATHGEGQGPGRSGRDQQASGPVDDGLGQAADGGRHDRNPARHGLQRDEPERLVPGHTHHRARRPQQCRQAITIDRATDLGACRHTEVPGKVAQQSSVGVVPVGAAGDDELDLWQPAERVQHVGHTLAFDETTHHDHAMWQAAPLDRPLGPKRGCVHSARDDPSAPGCHAVRAQLRQLVDTRRDDGVDRPGQVTLRRDAAGGTWIVSVEPSFDDAQGMEGLHRRDAEWTSGIQGRDAGHPEVRVRHVGPHHPPRSCQATPELLHVRQQPISRHEGGRARIDLLDDHARTKGEPARAVTVSPPRVDADVMAAARQGNRKPADVDVLTTGVRSSQRGNRIRMLRHECDPHTTSDDRRLRLDVPVVSPAGRRNFGTGTDARCGPHVDPRLSANALGCAAVDLAISGRRAAVAAASAGLGLAAARRLADEGVRVALCGRDPDRLAQAAATIEGAVAIQADVSTPEGATSFVEQATEALGGIDILVPNAGGPPAGNFASTPLDAYQPALALNLVSTVAMCQAAVPAMQAQRWGRVVAITSISVRQPMASLILSNTARAGATAFLKTLAREVAPDGVTVNSVQPGSHATDRLRQIYGDDLTAAAADIPSRAVGRPEDFGAVVAFLCSDAARFVTGASVPVDGGSYAGLL
jgi:3-oxoacyl-[acyl-carrier protein] reductase